MIMLIFSPPSAPSFSPGPTPFPSPIGLFPFCQASVDGSIGAAVKLNRQGNLGSQGFWSCSRFTGKKYKERAKTELSLRNEVIGITMDGQTRILAEFDKENWYFGDLYSSLKLCKGSGSDRCIFEFMGNKMGEGVCGIDRLYMILPLFEMNQSEAVALDKRPTSVVSNDKNGISQVTLRNSRGASVRISLYGGQVLSWKTEQGEELLFTSSKANFKPPMVVRGGIPICFPQFGSRGLLEQHGFARNWMWVITDHAPASPTKSNGQAFTDLLLKPSDDDLKI